MPARQVNAALAIGDAPRTRPPCDATTVLNELDRQLIAAMERGLPLVSRPYLEIGLRLGVPESEVIRRVRRLIELGVFKRLGVIVRHRELGYRANAMVVWDVPDQCAGDLGRRLARHQMVRLCYRRPRCLPQWPYNLFCMIHGHDRETVLQTIAEIVDRFALQDFPHQVLFSRRRFKQRGALYSGFAHSAQKTEQADAETE